MIDCFLQKNTNDATTCTILPLSKGDIGDWLAKQEGFIQNWVNSHQYLAKPHELCFIPNEAGKLSLVLIGCDETSSPWLFGDIPPKLPRGQYRIDPQFLSWSKEQDNLIALSWGLGSYTFDRYTTSTEINAQLILPEHADEMLVDHWLSSLYLSNDLVNTPCEDLGPQHLAEIVKSIAKECGAECFITLGDALLEENFNAIHAVGRAAPEDRAPRLIDLQWGDPQLPKITLVGKGVCFDTGGLDIKPASGMRTMKKDMGGAASVLALARMIMLQNWPVRLRLLIPAVENSVSANSYRPGDVITTRKGITVEVDNTDAEGRLILCDALDLACEESPDYLIDIATLTGARAIALGPEMPMATSNHQELGFELQKMAWDIHDPLWLFPLYQPYNRYLKSTIADCVNSSSQRYAGSITAALFLDKFVDNTIKWFHVDTDCYHHTAIPGHIAGPEIFSVRSIYAFLEKQLDL